MEDKVQSKKHNKPSPAKSLSTAVAPPPTLIPRSMISSKNNKSSTTPNTPLYSTPPGSSKHNEKQQVRTSHLKMTNSQVTSPSLTQSSLATSSLPSIPQSSLATSTSLSSQILNSTVPSKNEISHNTIPTSKPTNPTKKSILKKLAKNNNNNAQEARLKTSKVENYLRTVINQNFGRPSQKTGSTNSTPNSTPNNIPVNISPAPLPSASATKKRRQSKVNLPDSKEPTGTTAKRPKKNGAGKQTTVKSSKTTAKSQKSSSPKNVSSQKNVSKNIKITSPKSKDNNSVKTPVGSMLPPQTTPKLVENPSMIYTYLSDDDPNFPSCSIKVNNIQSNLSMITQYSNSTQTTGSNRIQFPSQQAFIPTSPAPTLELSGPQVPLKQAKVTFTQNTHFRRIPDGTNQLSSSSASSPKSSNSLAAQFRHPHNVYHPSPLNSTKVQCPIPKRVGQLKGTVTSTLNLNNNQILRNMTPAGRSLVYVNESIPLYRPPPNKKLNLRKNINKSFEFTPKNKKPLQNKFSLPTTDHRKIQKLQRQLRQKQDKFQKTTKKSSGKRK